MPKLNVLIAGSTGYIGIQLIKLLVKHKYIKIKYLCGNSSIGKKISNFDKSLSNKKLPKIVKFNKEYLNKINENIPKVIDEFEPDFIFYLSGVDILKNDRLGRLGVSLEGCKKRDKMILDLCKRNNIPLQISMGGGYSNDLKDIIEAHSNTFRLAQEIFF